MGRRGRAARGAPPGTGRRGLTGLRLPGPDGTRPAWAVRPLVALIGAYGLVSLVFLGHWTLSGDEFYFVVAGRHPSWGYADQPPLTPLLAGLADRLAPGSATALRLPAVLGTAATLLAGAGLARELGGGGRAQLLTAAALAVSPRVLGLSHRLATGTLDLPLWAAVCWLLARWAWTRDGRLWLPIGAVLAVALQNKYLVAGLALAVLAGLLLAGPRAALRHRGPWLAASAAALAAVPSLRWQARHDWPQLRLGEVVAAEVDAVGGRVGFPGGVLLALGLVGTVLATAGTIALLRSRTYAFLAVAALIWVAAVWAAGLRRDYVTGLFPLLIAAGSVVAEAGRLPGWCRRLTSWPAVAASAVLLARGLVPLPETWLGGADRWVLATHHDDWPGLARTVRAAVDELPADERARAVVIGGDYAKSSALTVLGPAYGLPPVLGDMRGAWYLAAPPYGTDTVVYVGPPPAALTAHCRRVEPAGTYVEPDPPPWQPPSRTPIVVCSGLTADWTTLWPRLRHLGLPG